MTSARARSARGGTRTARARSARPSVAWSSTGSAATLYAPRRGSARRREPVRLADVGAVDGLEHAAATAAAAPGSARAQRGGRERTGRRTAAGSRSPASRLKIRPGRRRTTRISGRGASITSSGRSACGLVARVERARDAVARPRLVDRAVLRPRRVDADRRRVHERGDARRRGGLEHAAAAVDVDRARARSRRGWAGSATRGGRPRRRPRRVGAQVVAGDVGARPLASAGRPRPAAGGRCPTISLTPASRPSADTTLVPTLPVAPVTTIRMTTALPGMPRG